MLRKGRKVNGHGVVSEGGGAPFRRAARDLSSHPPPTELSPAANRAHQLSQCYDMPVFGPSNATVISPSNISGAGKQRHSGVSGAFAAGSVSRRPSRANCVASIPSSSVTQRYNSAQATTPTRYSKLQHLSSNGTRTPPPIARGGDSYVKENMRLTVSDPIPSSARTQQKNRDAGGGSNGYTSTRRDTAVVAKSSDATPSGISGVDRPRASSLPRATEGVKDVLPRLRPLREGIHGGDLSGLRSPPSRLSTEQRGAPGSDPLSGLHNTTASGTVHELRGEGEPLREVLSAPPMSSTLIPPSYSPRPVTEQLRVVGRHGKRGGAHRSSGPGTGQVASADPRMLHPLWLNGNGGSDAGLASAGGPSDSGAAAAAAFGPGNGHSALNGARRRVKGGAGVGVSAAVTQRNATAPDRVDNPGCVDRRNGPEVRNTFYSVGSGHPDYSARQKRNEAVQPEALFDSTQALFSLLSDAGGGGTTVAGARPIPPPVPVTAPSSRTPNRTNSGHVCTESELPAYKFNVVLSSGKTATIPISLIAGSGCVQGMRPTMEDAHFAELNATHVHGQPISLLAVLDGHCGRRVADLGAKWLPHYVLHHAALGENNALALVESILQTDREIFHTLQTKKSELQRHLKKGGNSGGRRREVNEEMLEEVTNAANGGSTLIAAAVCGRMLYVACLGDARAVLYDGHTTIAMSEDHKPGNTDESRRIAKCGGFVQFGRVCGILAVSRALGDFEFKFQPSSSSSRDVKGEERLSADFSLGTFRDSDTGGLAELPSLSQNCRFISNRDLMVSNIADVRQLHLTDASAFLLLACDGLWDVLSNEEATEFVRDFLCYTPDVCDPKICSGLKPRPSSDVVQRVLNNCCQKLAEFAVDRGSMDNVSVMVLFFHDVVDTVARFSGRTPSSVKTSDDTRRRSVRQSNSLPGSGVAYPRNSTSSAFELTNNQLKVRNGRIVAQR
ncbi:hypothetical protein JKF63_06734 [Porcisia hertigi]|uniref:PPM-type phosphatase domain-containing protein n=1 Tax=Porcisia hertigi TaxID=2761500 RepID=A0A836IH50_9TRYP|nr:hypothetical protein JKF63_06734 [Porcisia hertigi]